MSGERSDAQQRGTPPTRAPIGRVEYGDPAVHRSLWSRVVGRALLVREFRAPPFSEFVKESDCAITVYTGSRRRPAVGKYFARSELGDERLASERLGYELFGDRPWRMPVYRWTSRGFTVPRLPNEARLDVASESMSHIERVTASATVLDVLLEIYLSGHIHGDLQPHNVWLYRGRLVATDFETLGPRTPGIPFMDSGDITGNDPAPRERPIDLAFGPNDKWSFHHVLGVSLDEAADALRQQLVRESEDDPFARHRLDALEGRLT